MSNTALGATACLSLKLTPWKILRTLDARDRVQWMRKHRTFSDVLAKLEFGAALDVELLLEAGGEVRPDGTAEPPDYVRRAVTKFAESVFLATGDVPCVIDMARTTPVVRRAMEEHKIQSEKRRQEQEKRASREAAYREERLDWIARFGSKRLKQAVSLDLVDSCDKVYREERLAMEFPGWRWYVVGEEHREPQNPTESEMACLASARAWCPDAKLVFVREAERFENEFYAETEPDDYMAVVARILGHTAVFRCEEQS